MFLNQTWSSPGITFNMNGSGATFSSPVSYPYLAPDPNQQTTFSTSYNNTSELVFSYQNTSPFTDAIIDFQLSASSGCGSYTYLSTGIDYEVFDQGGIQTDAGPFIMGTAGWNTNITIPAGGKLILKPDIQITGCINSCATEQVVFNWRCSWTPGAMFYQASCEHCISDINTVFNLQNNPSSIVVTRVEPGTNNVLPLTENWDNTCFGDNDKMPWEYHIENVGTETLTSVEIKLIYPIGSSTPESQMTLIYEDDILYSCQSCNISLPSFTQKSYYSCNLGIAVTEWSVTVTQMPPNTPFILNFETKRCIEESVLLLDNPAKYFNKWRLDVISSSICNSLPDINIPISSNSVTESDLNLAMVYSPSVNNITVPNMLLFGDPFQLNINLLNLFNDSPVEFDEQILGCNTADLPPNNCSYQGYLRVTVDVDDVGLIMNPSAQNLPKIVNGQLPPWQPFYYNIVGTGNCAPKEYYFYFDMGDINNAELYFENSSFEFEFIPCCDPDPVTHYSVRFDLMPGNVSCYTFNLSQAGNDHVAPWFDNSSCPDCGWIPLRKVVDEIEVQCPGCDKPGCRITHYKMERTSMGLPDANDDKIADNLTSLIWTPGSPYNTHYSFHGDLLTDRMIGNIFNGGATQDGYTFSEVQAYGQNLLDVLQIDRIVHQGGVSSMNLIPKKFTFYVDVPYNSLPCIDCLEMSDFDPNYSSNYETIRIIEVDATSTLWSQFVEINQLNNQQDLQIFFTFSNDPNDVNMNSGVVMPSGTPPAFSGFHPNHRYRLVMEYEVCGNFTTTDPQSVSLSQLKSSIKNHMWLSGQRQTSNAAGSILDASDDRVDLPFGPGYEQLLIDYVDTKLFWCEKLSGTHYFLSVEAFCEGNYINVNNSFCQKGITANFGCRVGGAVLYDYFPGEFRRPPFMPEMFSVNIFSSDYQISPQSVTVYSQFGFYSSGNHIFSSSAPVTVLNFNLGLNGFLEIPIPPNAMSNPECLNNNSVTPYNTQQTLLMGDQHTGFVIGLELLPNPCVEGLITATLNNDIQVEFIDLPPDYCSTGSTTNSNSCVIAGILNNLNPSINPLRIPETNLSFNFTTEETAFQNVVSWEFTVTNIFANNQTRQAEHVYLIVPDAQQVPYLSNWELISIINGIETQIPIMQNNTFPVAGIIPVSNTIHQFRLQAKYISCQITPPTLSFNVEWGWACIDYPNQGTFMAQSCDNNVLSLELENGSFDLASTGKVIPSQSITPCVNFTCSSEFTSNHAAFYPAGIQISNVPSDLFIFSVTIENCDNPVPIPLTEDPNTPGLYLIDQNMLSSLNFPDYNMDHGDCINVILTLSPGCYFDGLSLPLVTILGVNFCGDPASESDSYNGSMTFYGNTCPSCFTITKEPLQTMAAPYQVVSFEIEVCSDAQTGIVNLVDFLPAGFELTSSCGFCQPPVPVTPLLIDFSNFSYPYCTTLTVLGYYTEEAECSANVNQAQISFVPLPGLATFTMDDNACIEVSCQGVSDYHWLDGEDVIQVFSNMQPPPTPPYSLTSATISISGTFTINEDLTLSGCTVYMYPGAQIMVSPGFTFTLDNTTITGCYTMWNRIRVMGEAEIVVENGSHIRDADVGIYAEDRAAMRISNSYITECVRQIYVPPHVNPNLFNTLINTSISSSVFGMISATGFKPDYAGQISHGDKPFAGIELNDMATLTIGRSGTAPNQFVNMHAGIIAHRSQRITVLNSGFVDIQPDGFYSTGNNFKGATVASFGDQIIHKFGDVVVMPVPGMATMQNCFTGIHTHYSNLRANGLTMTGMRTGVYSELCTDLLTTDFNGNTIEASFRGIDWFDNEGAANMSAIGNFIYISGDPAGVGIETREQNITGLARYRLEYNYVNLNNALAGIIASTTLSPRISCNVIEQYQNNAQSSMTGIEILGSPGAFVSRNHVVSFTSGTTGIRNWTGVNCIFTCNTVEEQEFGLLFSAPCGLASNISGNIMYHCSVGLFYDGSAVTGGQEHKGNRWINVPLINVDQAVNMNFGGFTQSIYFVHVPTGSTYHPQVNPPTWFFDDPSGTPYSCSSIITCHQQLVGGGEEDVDYSLINAIINDSIITVDYPYESQNMAKRQLFDMLAWNDSLLNSDSAFVSFYNQLDSTATGQLHQFSQRLSTTELFDSTFTTLVIYADSLISLYSDSLNYIDSLALADTTIDYSSQRDVFITELLFHRNTRTNLVAQKQLLVEGIRDSVLVINNMVTPTELPEWNERSMNEYYYLYKRYGKDSLSPYYSAILDIALQCPSAGGPSVFRARNFVRLFNDTMIYNDTWVCLQAGYYRSANTSQSMPSKRFSEIKLVPNPANEYVDIIIGNRNGEVANMKLLNVNGEQVASANLNSESNKVRLSTIDLSPGVYFVKVICGKKVYPFEKLVIIK